MPDSIEPKDTDEDAANIQENKYGDFPLLMKPFDAPEDAEDLIYCDFDEPSDILLPLSPVGHNLSLDEPHVDILASQSTKNHSMFDGELKGLYAEPVALTTPTTKTHLELLEQLREVRNNASNSKTSDGDDKPLSFLLAYRDQDSLSTQAFFTHDAQSEQVAIDQASAFFERNCGYKDFTARWLTDYCNTSSYARDMVRVIAATNTRTGDKEIIYVSNNVGVIRYNNLSNLDTNPSSTKEELYEERPISNLADVEGIITGLTVIGYLSFSPDDLAARNTTIEKSAKIMMVRMTATTDYATNLKTDDDATAAKPITRYISGISSNDPSHIRIWHSSTGESMDYSSFAHKQRWSKVSKSIKPDGIDLPPPAKTLSEKVWVYGSMTNSTYYRMYDKRHLTAESLKHSLLFSEEFLRLFVEVSNKQAALSVRRIAGAKDAYHIFIDCKEVLLDGLFRPKNVFELDVSAESNYWQSNFSIFDTIREGWGNEALCYENWNDNTYEYETMLGSYKQILSHWLFTLVVNLYFNSTSVKKPRTLRPKAALQSLPLKNVRVISKGFMSSQSLKDDYRDTNSAADLADSQLFGFELGSLQISLGYSLFELTATKNGRELTYSFFLSSDNNGLFSSETGDNENSITIVVSNKSDVAETIWCIKDVGYALTVAKDAITSSDLAQLKGMDVYDAMREIDKTANSYGVKLNANFSL